jgi:hypothetical protein
MLPQKAAKGAKRDDIDEAIKKLDRPLYSGVKPNRFQRLWRSSFLLVVEVLKSSGASRLALPKSVFCSKNGEPADLQAEWA